MSSKKQRKNSINAGHYLELMDRIHIVCCTIDEHILNHPLSENEPDIQRKLDEYSRTPQGIKNAEYDFGNSQYQGETPTQPSSSMDMPSSSTESDPIQGFMSDIFGGQLKNAAMLAI